MVDLQRRTPVRRYAPSAVIAVSVLLAFLVRFAFVDDVSGDYRAFLSPWYDQLAQQGGFAAVGADFSNYNPPYLYLLAAMTYLPLPKIVAIKLISMVFDVVLATFAALIVRQLLTRPAIWVSALRGGAVCPDRRGEQCGVGAVRLDLRGLLPGQSVLPAPGETLVGLHLLRVGALVQAAGHLLPAGVADRAGGQPASTVGAARGAGDLRRDAAAGAAGRPGSGQPAVDLPESG